MSPAVECTSTSAAASTAGICSVKPQTTTSSRPAYRAARRSRAPSLRPASTSTRAPARSASSTARAQVAHGPAAARDDDEAARLGQPDRAPRGARVRRVAERGVAEAVGGLHARRRPRDRPHLGLGLRVDEQVQVDAGVRPVAQRGEVGDGRHDGDPQRARAAQAPEDLARPRVRGDDDAGVVGGHRAPQPAAADRVDRPRAEAPRRPPLRDEAMPDVEGHVARPRLELGRPARQRARHRPGRVEAVDDRRLRAALAQRGRQQPRGEVVALADRRRDDEDARHAGVSVASSQRRTVAWCAAHAPHTQRPQSSTRTRCSSGPAAAATSATVTAPRSAGGSSHTTSGGCDEQPRGHPAAGRRCHPALVDEAQAHEVHGDRAHRLRPVDARMLRGVRVDRDAVVGVRRVGPVLAGEDLPVELPARGRRADVAVRDARRRRRGRVRSRGTWWARARRWPGGYAGSRGRAASSAQPAAPAAISAGISRKAWRASATNATLTAAITSSADRDEHERRGAPAPQAAEQAEQRQRQQHAVRPQRQRRGVTVGAAERPAPHAPDLRRGELRERDGLPEHVHAQVASQLSRDRGVVAEPRGGVARPRSGTPATRCAGSARGGSADGGAPARRAAHA